MNTVASVRLLPESDGNIEIEFDKPSNARDIPVLTYALYGNNDTNSKYVSIIKNALFKQDDEQSVGNTVVFSDIRPLDSNLNFYFSSVEIAKKVPDGGVQEYIEFKLTPELGENASIDNALSQVSTFTISVDRFLDTSNSSNRQFVGYAAQFFDDKIKEQYLKAKTPPNGRALDYPMSDRDRDAWYDVIGVANGSSKATYFVFQGHIRNIRNKGTTEEASQVYFNQAIPLNRSNITTYNGRIRNMRDLIRFCYDPNFGWKRNLVYRKLLDRRYGRQYFNYNTRVMMFRFMRMVFGRAPQLLHKYMRNIVSVQSPRTKKQYETKRGGRSYVVNSFIPSEDLVPLGNHFDFTNYINQNSNGVRKVDMQRNQREILPNINPFLCGLYCVENDDCNFFQQVKNTCNLYNVSDPQVSSYMKNYVSPTGGIKTFRGYGLKREQHADLQNKGINYMKNINMRKRPEFTSGIDTFSKEDLQRILKRLRIERQGSKIIQTNIKESFANNDTSGVYLDSTATSLQTALKEAEGYKKTYEMTKSQATYGINQKIYYNLFTTSLWIINIACLVGILYIVLVGFMGVELGEIVGDVAKAAESLAPKGEGAPPTVSATPEVAAPAPAY